MLRPATAAVLLASLLSCTTVQHVRTSSDVVPDEPLAILWVTNEYDEVIPVAQPRLLGDSLVGTWVGVGQRVAIPLEPGTDVRRFDAGRTALVGLGLTAGTIMLLMLNGSNGPSGDADMNAMCNDPEMMGDCM